MLKFVWHAWDCICFIHIIIREALIDAVYKITLTLFSELHSKDPNNKPKFELSYTTEDEYGLKDLSPLQWASVVSRYRVLFCMHGK